MTLAAKPDLILLFGDYVIHGVVGGKFVEPEELVRSLGRLSAPAGVFAVLGNHDRWYFAKRMENAIDSAGISVLEDAAVSIRSKQCEFSLVGLSDFLDRTT